MAHAVDAGMAILRSKRYKSAPAAKRVGGAVRVSRPVLGDRQAISSLPHGPSHREKAMLRTQKNRMNAASVRRVFRAVKPVLPCGQHKHYHPERCGLQQQKPLAKTAQTGAILASGQRAGNRILSKIIVLIVLDRPGPSSLETQPSAIGQVLMRDTQAHITVPQYLRKPSHF